MRCLWKVFFVKTLDRYKCGLGLSEEGTWNSLDGSKYVFLNNCYIKLEKSNWVKNSA